MKFAAGSWQTVGAAGLSAGWADHTSLAIDSTGTPHVAYEDQKNGARATVMKYEGGLWQTVGTPGFGGGYMGVEYVSLAFDSAGMPYVAFREWTTTTSGSTTVMNLTVEVTGSNPVSPISVPYGIRSLPENRRFHVAQL